MARTSIATDNFNRASLGSDWAQLNSATSDVTINSSIRIAGTSDQPVSGAAAARWVGAGTFADDQYSSIEIIGLGHWTNQYHVGVIVRASADTGTGRDFYGASVEYDASSSPYPTRLYKIVNGTYTSIYSALVAWADGDKIELEVEGSELRVCKNGTPLGGSFTQTDTSLTTGAPGVCVSGAGVAYGDNWEGGNMGGGFQSAWAVNSNQVIQ